VTKSQKSCNVGSTTSKRGRIDNENEVRSAVRARKRKRGEKGLGTNKHKIVSNQWPRDKGHSWEIILATEVRNEGSARSKYVTA